MSNTSNISKKSKQGLQRFTTLLREPVENYTELKDVLEKTDKEELEPFIDAIGKELLSISVSIKPSNLKIDLLQLLSTKFKTKKTENITKEHNRHLIIDAIHRCSYTGALPSVTEIAKITGLSRPTVYKHLECISIEHSSEDTSKYKVLGDNALLELYKLGMCGDVRALGMVLKFTQNTLQPPKQNTYIQINNTKVEVGKIEALPKERRERILQLLDPKYKFVELPAQIFGGSRAV